MTVIVKNKTPLVVPTAVRRRAGFKSGDKLEFRVSDGVVTILPKQPDDEYTHAQREAIDRAVAEGLDDVKHGRLQGPFSSHKEFIASLHREARKPGKPLPTVTARGVALYSEAAPRECPKMAGHRPAPLTTDRCFRGQLL
jgi:bifunctional DNA-binding transcriptional regulator/antitoxin component of YhaV-PrlF toxin-antitoxin module